MEIDGWTNEWRMECQVYGEATRKRKKKGNGKDGSSIDLFTDCVTERLTDSSTIWLTDWQTHWLSDSLTDYLTDSLTVWLTDGWTNEWRIECLVYGEVTRIRKKKGNRKMDLSDLFTNCMTERLTDSSTVWQTDWLTHWLSDSLTVWPTDWLTNSLTGWLTDWVIDWLAHRLSGWLTFWLTDWLIVRNI